MQKKLESKTVSCYFMEFPDRTKGYRFYSPKYNTRFVETQRAVFIEEENTKSDNVSFEFDKILEHKEFVGKENQRKGIKIIPFIVLNNKQATSIYEEENHMISKKMVEVPLNVGIEIQLEQSQN